MSGVHIQRASTEPGSEYEHTHDGHENWYGTCSTAFTHFSTGCPVAPSELSPHVHTSPFQDRAAVCILPHATWTQGTYTENTRGEAEERVGGGGGGGARNEGMVNPSHTMKLETAVRKDQEGSHQHAHRPTLAAV